MTGPDAGRPAEQSPPGAPVDLVKSAPAAVEDQPAQRRTLRAWLPALALMFVIAVLAGGSAVLWSAEREQSDRADRLNALAAVQDPSGAALRAASRAVETLLSYDYRSLDADFAAGKALLTPEFAAEYAEFTDKLIRPPALQAKARVVARTQALAPLEASTPTRAVVLAFVNQITTSALLEAPAVDQSRVTLTLEKIDGQWLVSDLVVTGSRPPGDEDP